VVLVRSGWGRRFDEGAEAYLGKATGVPGVGEAGAQWLADRRLHAVGADTIAFERLTPGGGHSLLPAHRVLLVESGIYIVEALALEELAAAQVSEFTLVLVPMNLLGATGSPVRPLAVLAGE
jgi:kynurenine formamidase